MKIQAVRDILEKKKSVFFLRRTRTLRLYYNIIEFGNKCMKKVELDKPSNLTDAEFTQNIYDEYKDYNDNHKVKFNLLSKSFLWDS